MKRIGITQRRDAVTNRTEFRDALDVNWASLLWELGILPIPLCSDIKNEQAYLQALNIDGFILSGGDDVGEMPKRDALESAILEYAKTHKLPVLGVCRGMQFINCFQGGTLVEVVGHVATMHSILSSSWIAEYKIKHVNSFHNYGIIKETIGKDLIILAETGDGVVEAIKHKIYPWLGIMWHPERDPLANFNKNLIKEHFEVK